MKELSTALSRTGNSSFIKDVKIITLGISHQSCANGTLFLPLSKEGLNSIFNLKNILINSVK